MRTYFCLYSIASKDPVIYLTFLSKFLERERERYAKNHLPTHYIFKLFKFAFNPLHSTGTALVSVANDLHLSADSDGLDIFLLPDFSATFDPVTFFSLGSFLQESLAHLVHGLNCIFPRNCFFFSRLRNINTLLPFHTRSSSEFSSQSLSIRHI